MRALVQRVSEASVSVGGEEISRIGEGLLVLLGIARGDRPESADRLADQVRALRVFEDARGRMNESLGDREILCVSQFTLYADTRRGNRPSFAAAAPAVDAQGLYQRFCDRSGAKRGRFGVEMAVALTNQGPVTLMLSVPGEA
jgi:D-tyrosyl-tRNA(Tyr) deacylase